MLVGFEDGEIQILEATDLRQLYRFYPHLSCQSRGVGLQTGIKSAAVAAPIICIKVVFVYVCCVYVRRLDYCACMYVFMCVYLCTYKVNTYVCVYYCMCM